MNDLNNKLRERWNQKKKKAGNWSSLFIKIFLLLAVIYVVSKISTSKSIDWSKLKGTADTVQVAP